MVLLRSTAMGQPIKVTERFIMANLTLDGTVLGLQSKPYDFVDRENGERRQGTSHVLHLWDERAVEPVAVRVPENQLIAAQGLGGGEVVTLAVQIFTRNNRATFTLAGVLATAS